MTLDRRASRSESGREIPGKGAERLLPRGFCAGTCGKRPSCLYEGVLAGKFAGHIQREAPAVSLRARRT